MRQEITDVHPNLVQDCGEYETSGRKLEDRDITASFIWDIVAPGDAIEIQHPLQPALSGVVDEVTADSTVVWVQLDNGQGRILMHIDDGIHLRLSRRPRLAT